MDFPFSFNPKSALLLIFFFNGIVFATILIRKGILNQHNSSIWLGFLLLLCSLYIAPYMLGYAGWYSRTTTREILFFIPFMQVLVIGPVVFFYIRSLLSRTFQFQKKDWWHFVPGILYLGYSLVIFITDKLILDEFYFYADGRDKDLKTWYQLTGLFSMMVYLVLCLKKYQSYKKSIFDTVSYAETILFKWIQHFLVAFLMLLILRVLFFIFTPQWVEFGNQFWYYICFSLVFFYIAFNGYTHAVKASITFFEEEKEPVHLEEEEKTVTIDIDIDFWKTKIQQLMLDKQLFTNPKLTLTDVATQLQTNSKTVSTTINTGFEMNFNDFVNQFRVEAVIDALKNNQQKNTTLLGIAFDCGFNSKATFNRAFKKSTSLTPKEYTNKLI